MGPRNTTVRVSPEKTHYPSDVPRQQSNVMPGTPRKLAPVGMLHPQLHQDFQRFCQLVATVVMESWGTAEERNECETPTEPRLWPEEFADCETDFQRVSLLMRHSTIRQFILLPADQTPVCRSSLKCDSTSDELRDQGNCAWQRREIPQAISYYTKAVFHAASSERRALAFLNRSCVLAHVGVHQAVLEDTAYAQTEFFQTRDVVRGISDLRHVSLLIDRGVGRCDSLSKAARSAVEMSGRSGEQNPSLYVNHPDPPTRVPEGLVTNGDQRLGCQHPSRMSGNSTQPIPAEPAYQILYNENKAERHVVANRDFLPGELVLIERPVVRRLNPDLLEMNCYQCFRRSYNLYPCRGCSEVGFCSRACEQIAWETPASPSNNERIGLCHRFECGQLARFPKLDLAGWSWLERQNIAVLEGYQALLFKSSSLTERTYGTDVCWLAYASIAQIQPRKLQSLAQGTSTKDGVDQTDDTTPELSQSSLSASSGVNEPPSPDLSVCDVSLLWQNTVAAVFLTHCLKAGGYQIDWGDNCLLDPSENTLLVDEQPLPASWAAAVMLQHMLALSYAGQDVTCMTYVNRNSAVSDIPEVIWDRIEVDKLGKALYPLTGLLTVSCDPNTHTVHMADGVCALFTVQQIKSSEILSRARSGQFVGYNRLESQSRLRCNYLIEDCRCGPCHENRSTQSPSTMFRCPQCQHTIRLNAADANNLDSEESCRCPRADLSSILQRYSKLVQEAEDELVRIPLYYQCLAFHQFPRQLLDKHISFLVRMLGSDGLDGVLVRPSQSLSKLQNLLRQLLALRHGCCVTETCLVRMNNEESDCSNCLIS
ncbi:hypothetical protein P879_04168 [Paragonimus westermani]|uniref:MYND-type domain-containing protein n=1 Tax=Paragonimus westermani TaxID=34504 RepID=A0A8T0DJ88_9TREM|nr:hypothetical protein P879_04168 [Paragonimus westermani]